MRGGIAIGGHIAEDRIMNGAYDKPAKARGKWLKRGVFLAIILLVAAGLVYNYYWPSNRHFTISPETTYISGPLNDDGTINYVAALNEMMSKGVTRENNAAPLLIQAWGADEMIRLGVHDKVFQILQMVPVTATGARGPDLEDVVKDMWPKGAPKGATTRPSPEDVEKESERVLKRAIEGPWSADELPAVAAWLKANEERLALVSEAAKRPRYYIPLVSTDDPPWMFNVQYYYYNES